MYDIQRNEDFSKRLEVITQCINPSMEAFDTIVMSIKEWEQGLPKDRIPGFKAIGLGSEDFQMTRIVRDGNMWIVEGQGINGPVRLMQHYTQISILCVSILHDPDVPKKPIGFHTESN